jgi:hypothetical protein
MSPKAKKVIATAFGGALITAAILAPTASALASAATPTDAVIVVTVDKTIE